MLSSLYIHKLTQSNVLSTHYVPEVNDTKVNQTVSGPRGTPIAKQERQKHRKNHNMTIIASRFWTFTQHQALYYIVYIRYVI